jgi:hypothetical protein
MSDVINKRLLPVVINELKPTRRPDLFILKTDDLVDDYRQTVSSCVTVEYNPDSIGHDMMELINKGLPAMEKHSQRVFHGIETGKIKDDDDIYARAFNVLTYAVWDRLKAAQAVNSKNQVPYLFDRWLGDDLVITRFEF